MENWENKKKMRKWENENLIFSFSHFLIFPLSHFRIFLFSLACPYLFAGNIVIKLKMNCYALYSNLALDSLWPKLRLLDELLSKLWSWEFYCVFVFIAQQVAPFKFQQHMKLSWHQTSHQSDRSDRYLIFICCEVAALSPKKRTTIS